MVSGKIEAVLTDSALATTRQDIGQARHAPGFVYSGPEMLEREKQAIFMKDWLFVARAEEIPNPGDYVTMRILGEPIVISRDSKGEINAFVNMCLHRGVEVVTGGKGNAKRFSCPYHGWTYDSSGKLIGAAHMTDIACFKSVSGRMKPLKVELWEGNVMVTFNPDPRPFDEFIAPLVAGVGYSRPGLCRVASTVVTDLPCNWKFVMENFLDFYHVGVVHAKSLARSFKMQKDGGAIQLDSQGGTAMRYHQAAPTPDGKSLFGNMPWLTAEDEAVGISGLAYLVPNLCIFSACDVIRVLSVWPTSPTTSQLTTRLLIPAERMDDPNLAEKMEVYSGYLNLVLSEDFGMLESMQNAMSSSLFVPGPMAELECSIHNSVNYLITRAVEHTV